MPLPTAYDETTLSEFMIRALGSTATALGLEATSDIVTEAVYDTLTAYGVDDIADADDVPKLRALARVAAWQAVVDATAGNIDFRMGDQSLTASQIHAQALQNLRGATTAALPYDSTYVVTRTAVTHSNDPYRTIETMT